MMSRPAAPGPGHLRVRGLDSGCSVGYMTTYLDVQHTCGTVTDPRPLTLKELWQGTPSRYNLIQGMRSDPEGPWDYASVDMYDPCTQPGCGGRSRTLSGSSPHVVRAYRLLATSIIEAFERGLTESEPPVDVSTLDHRVTMDEV